MSNLRKTRSRRGGSLLTVLLIGLISSLWISALMGLVLPSYSRAAYGRNEIALRSAAEAALDWGISTLNRYPSIVDDRYEDQEAGPKLTVPKNVMGDYGGNNITATMQVSNRRPPTDSYIYDPTLDPANSATNGGITTNGWRIVTATATSGRMTKTVRVLCKPTYQSTPTFDYGVFGREGVAINGTGFTNSYDSAGTYDGTVSNVGGDIGSNALVELTGTAVVGGDVRVLSDPPGSLTEVVSGTTGVRIEGTLTTNGTVASNGSGPAYTDSNVLGHLEDGSTSADAIQTQQFYPQRQIAAAPSAPATATNLGAVSVTGRETLTLAAPGDYIMSSLAVGGTGRIVFSGSGPVRIYVQGTSASVAIAGNGIVNAGRPSNLQIYYNGTSNTSVAGNGTFTGVMYAPNSNIAISGNGGVYGSVVGNAVTVNGTGFHYDRSLSSFNPVNNMALNRIQTVSWQEP